jgi:hypothetical protein
MLSVANHTFYAECLMLNVIMPSVVILNVMVSNIQHLQVCNVISFSGYILPCQIGLYYPLDGITNHKEKLMQFLTTKLLQREEGTSF